MLKCWLKYVPTARSINICTGVGYILFCLFLLFVWSVLNSVGIANPTCRQIQSCVKRCFSLQPVFVVPLVNSFHFILLPFLCYSYWIVCSVTKHFPTTCHHMQLLWRNVCMWVWVCVHFHRLKFMTLVCNQKPLNVNELFIHFFFCSVFSTYTFLTMLFAYGQ